MAKRKKPQAVGKPLVDVSPSKWFGGLLGNAAKGLSGREQRLKEQEDKAMGGGSRQRNNQSTDNSQ